MALHDEIFEQGAVLAGCFEQNQERVAAVAGRVPADSVQHVVVAARGTSDNAARYAGYLWGATNRLSVTLATPSLFSLYQRPPRLDGALVVGISQSGQSPDIVSVLAEGRRQGRPTLAITNEPDSPLARTADFVLPTLAGREEAVAATKTYTTQLLVIAMLSAAWAGDGQHQAVMARLPGWVDYVLALEPRIARLAERYRYMEQCVVLGRGFNYATAFEWSLKLKELTAVVAEPYSSADFLHGPIAMVSPGFPVMAVAVQGAVLADMRAVLEKLAGERRADCLIISNDPAALALSDLSLQIPDGLPEWISPLVTIIPGQLFSYHLTRVKGLDTENPAGLTKVTETH